MKDKSSFRYSKIFAGMMIFVLLAVDLFGVGTITPVESLVPAEAYVEPGLWEADAESLSVIVTASDSGVAARAVERVGGEVRSDLRLVGAVAAIIPVIQIQPLASLPGIVSVVENKTVRTADGSGTWDGWVTNRRIKKGSYLLDDELTSPAAFLPDGGMVSIAKNGKVLLTNGDGSERARISLSGGPFKTAAVVTGADGTIFIAGEAKKVHALNPDGSSLWVFEAAHEKFLCSVTLGLDGTVYIADQRRTVYALAPSTGELLWQYTVSDGGDVVSTSIVGPEGTVYVPTNKGYLFAFDPNGSLKWEFSAGSGAPFVQSPKIGADGTVYLVGEDKLVVAINPDGTPKYEFVTGSKILAAPTLASDGRLYVATENQSLYALRADGSLAFEFRPNEGKFKTTPVLSPDESTVYVAVEEKKLYAVDTATGAERWHYQTFGKIVASPVVDHSGTILVASESDESTSDGALVALSSDGSVSFVQTFSEKITQSPGTDANGNVSVRIGTSSLETWGLLPDHWDGRPDIQSTETKKVWKLVNPVAIDMGADIVQETLLDGRPVTGEGVTIAVVDTGVHFDHEVKLVLGNEIQKLFMGQADFVNPVCQTYKIKKRTYTIGTQYDGYCLLPANDSVDAYGHGSHVAGIVWNNFSDYATEVSFGIAPDTNILSVRVLDELGDGSYEDVINGIQYVVEHRDEFNIRVLNLSLSASATTPYFLDPLNRAVEAAWEAGIVVVTAAGNLGPGAETISVPGNDPYVITVGAINSNRTPGYWSDDFIPEWSSTGPTRDRFVKPDVLAPGSNIVSFMYNDPDDPDNSAYLVQQHPDYSETMSLFRMSGTSMATAATSGVVALMLDAHPELTPDQVKYRLMVTARRAMHGDAQAFNFLQQGAGRIWAPDAVLGEIPDGNVNGGMDISADLSHGWGYIDEQGNPVLDEAELSYHYVGPIRRVLSDDGTAYFYFVQRDSEIIALGAVSANDLQWTIPSEGTTWAGGDLVWAGGDLVWAGGDLVWAGGDLVWAGGDLVWAGGDLVWAGGDLVWAGGDLVWAGGDLVWAGGDLVWAGGDLVWAGGDLVWAGGDLVWAGGDLVWAGGDLVWAGGEWVFGLNGVGSTISSTTWVGE